MATDKRRFEVFVSYFVQDEESGQVNFGNIFINIDVNRNANGYLPENLTAQMIMQLRAQVAVNENVDEETIHISNLYLLESPPQVVDGIITE